MRNNWTKAIVIVLGGASLMLALTSATPSTAEARYYRPRNHTPEINPNALASTIALVVGGASMLRDRRRNKK